MRNLLYIFISLALTKICLSSDQHAFIDTYCIKCHGEKKQKADRRFDDLPDKIETPLDIERYQEIVDQLNLYDMPPEDEDEPSDSERIEMIHALTAKITDAHTSTGIPASLIISCKQFVTMESLEKKSWKY